MWGWKIELKRESLLELTNQKTFAHIECKTSLTSQHETQSSRELSGQLKCKFGASADLLMRRRKPLRISLEPLLQVAKKLCVSVGIPWQLNWEWRSANAIRVPANIWILQLLTAIDQNHCNWNKIKELRDLGATAIYDRNWQKHATMRYLEVNDYIWGWCSPIF